MRRGPVRSGGPVPSRASGFTVFVFMAPAWLRGPGQHIGKTPGVPPDPAPRDQGGPAARSAASPGPPVTSPSAWPADACLATCPRHPARRRAGQHPPHLRPDPLPGRDRVRQRRRVGYRPGAGLGGAARDDGVFRAGRLPGVGDTKRQLVLYEGACTERASWTSTWPRASLALARSCFITSKILGSSMPCMLSMVTTSSARTIAAAR